MFSRVFKLQLKKENQDLKSGGKTSGKEGKKKADSKEGDNKQARKEEKTKVCYTTVQEI